MSSNDQLLERITSMVSQVLSEKGMMPGKPAGSGTACSLPHGMAAAGPANGTSSDPLVSAGAARVGHAAAGAAPPDSKCATMGQYIDHTLLKPTSTDADVIEICSQAREYSFASVCINPSYVPLAARELAGTNVKVCTVIGFPLGSTSTETKAFETRDCVAKGAHEIDMVINIGKLKAGDFQYVCDDIRAVVHASQGRLVKVIIETSMLTDDEKVSACILSKAAGASYVKTSTGFGGGGAEPEDVALMRRTVGEALGVKASGGIRDCSDADAMIAAGATRLGASASVAIVSGKKGTSSY